VSWGVMSKSLNKVLMGMPKELAESTEFPVLSVNRSRSLAVDSFNDNTKAYLRVGFRTVDLKHKDITALAMLGDVLGSPRISRLMIALRYQKGLVYGAGAGNYPGTDSGEFVISTSCQSVKLQETIDTIIYEVSRIRKGDLSEEEFELFKTRAVKSRYEAMQTSVSWLGNVQEFIFNRSKPTTVVDYMNAVEEVTKDEVVAVAQKYLNPDNMYVSVVGATASPTIKSF
jgi:zinc protease